MSDEELQDLFDNQAGKDWDEILDDNAELRLYNTVYNHLSHPPEQRLGPAFSQKVVHGIMVREAKASQIKGRVIAVAISVSLVILLYVVCTYLQSTLITKTVVLLSQYRLYFFALVLVFISAEAADYLFSDKAVSGGREARNSVSG
jgi:hypothetical protein